MGRSLPPLPQVIEPGEGITQLDTRFWTAGVGRAGEKATRRTQKVRPGSVNQTFPEQRAKVVSRKMSSVAEGRVDFRHVQLGQLSKPRSEKAD